MAAVSIDRVGKLYPGGARAMRDVSIEIGAGEFLVLVGPSGCGKSTLLRMVAGLEEISEGEIRIGGVRANEKAPRERDVAMVFQSYALYPHMTVRENMSFGLRVRKVGEAEIEKRVEEAARLLELTALLDRLPKAMSGGQRQRVAMGRAIVRQPKVFLFDEPLSNLDAALRGQMRAELKALHARLGATMIYVTHDQVEAMTLADRIAVLRAGELQQIGTPQELFDHPANRFVAGFIGSPAMNFVDGSADAGRFRAGGVDVPLEGADGACVLGVRPHDLRVDGGGGIEARIELIEPMGWEAMVHLRGAAGRLVARVDGAEMSALRVGQGLRLSIAPGRAHRFPPSGPG